MQAQEEIGTQQTTGLTVVAMIRLDQGEDHAEGWAELEEAVAQLHLPWQVVDEVDKCSCGENHVQAQEPIATLHHNNSLGGS